MRKTINIDFDNSSSVILGYDPDILGTKASAYALSTHSHGNVLLALTNLTGAVTSVSNGLTIALEAGTAGGGGLIHAGDNITLGTALGHTTVSAYGLADATHNHGGAPSITGLIGGTIASDNWSISIPDFLLTAALSNHTHSNLAGNSTSTVTIAGTNLTLTANETGLTFGVPAWITTAGNSTHTHGSFLGTNIVQVSSGSGGLALSVPNFAGTQTSVTNASISVNTRGISLNIPEGKMYFVDASGVSWSTNSSGLSTSITAYYNSSHTHGNMTTASTTGTDIKYSSSSNGLTLGIPNYITSGGNIITIDGNKTSSGATGYSIISSGTLTLAGGSNITLIQNGNIVSISGPEYFAGTTTAATNVGLTVNSQGIRVSLDTAGLTSFGDGVNVIAAGGSTAASNATIAFINANRVSFTLNSDSLSASIGEYIKTGFTTTATAGTELVGTANSDGLKLGVPAFMTTYSAIRGVIVSDSTYTSGSISFSNANNISFGSSGEGVITASISYPSQTAQPVAISDSATSILFSTLSLGTGNGMTLYLSDSKLVGSYTVPDVTSLGRVVSINGTSGSLSISASRNISINSSEGSALTFYGPSNILNSFYITGNSATDGSSQITGGGFVLAGGDHITLSQSNNTISMIADGGIAFGVSDSTFTSGTVILSGQANITVNTTLNAGIQYIRLSAAGGTDTAGADGGNILAAGSQTANSTGNVKFVDSNGVTFGMSNNSDITASVAAISRVVVSDSTMVSNFISFSNANNISFGASGANIITISTGTHEHTQYVGLLSTGVTGASATINNSAHYLNIPQGSLYYQDGGGVTWGANSSGLSTTITASVADFAGAYIREVSLSGNISGTQTDVSSGTLYLAGGNNITLSQNGNSITISGANIGGAQTGISGIAGSAASTVSVGTVQFANANGISFGLSSNTMTASYDTAAYIGTAYLNFWQATEASKGLMYTTYTQHTHGSNISWGSTTHTSETAMRASSSSNGLTIVVPPYITAAGVHTHGSNVSTATYTTGGTAATSILFSSASDGLTMSYPAYAVTSHTHSNLYANVTHGHGTVYTVSIAGSVLTNSSNSSGLTLGVPAWLTTAGSVAHTHGSNVSLSLTNLSGSVSSASSGLTLSLTGYPATSFVNVSQSSILNFSDANGILWGSSTAGSTTTITASYGGLWRILASGGSTAGTSSSVFGSVLNIVAGSNITLSGGSGGITVIA